VNSLPETVTRQRRDCHLNPGASAPESSTLTTRLPSHSVLIFFQNQIMNFPQWFPRSTYSIHWRRGPVGVAFVRGGGKLVREGGADARPPTLAVGERVVPGLAVETTNALSQLTVGVSEPRVASRRHHRVELDLGVLRLNPVSQAAVTTVSNTTSSVLRVPSTGAVSFGQYSTARTVQYSTARTVQYTTVLYSTVLHVQYSTVQYCTVQYSTVQYCTVQYSTVQYSTARTVQYSTARTASTPLTRHRII